MNPAGQIFFVPVLGAWHTCLHTPPCTWHWVQLHHFTLKSAKSSSQLCCTAAKLWTAAQILAKKIQIISYGLQIHTRWTFFKKKRNYLSSALQLTNSSTPFLSVPPKGHLSCFQVLFPKPFPWPQPCRAVADPLPPHIPCSSPAFCFSGQSFLKCSTEPQSLQPPPVHTESCYSFEGKKHHKTPNKTPLLCLWGMELFGIKLSCTAPHTTNSSHCLLGTDLLEALFLKNRLNSTEICTQMNF